MYQELQVFEDTFECQAFWGTEGNDLPLPAFSVGDVFEHQSVPHHRLRRMPEHDEVFKVVAVKHVFTETGPGPEANHLLMVAIALDGAVDPREQALEEARQELIGEKRRGDFFEALTKELGRHYGEQLFDQVAGRVESTMKANPATGIEEEAKSAWHETAKILQANGHILADMAVGEVEAAVWQTLTKLKRAEKIALLLQDSDLDGEYCGDWPAADEFFDPMVGARESMGFVAEQITKLVLSSLYDEPLER